MKFSFKFKLLSNDPFAEFVENRISSSRLFCKVSRLTVNQEGRSWLHDCPLISRAWKVFYYHQQLICPLKFFGPAVMEEAKKIMASFFQLTRTDPPKWRLLKHGQLPWSVSPGISPGGWTDVMLLWTNLWWGPIWDQEAKTPKIAEVGNAEVSGEGSIKLAGAAGIFLLEVTPLVFLT